MVEAAIAAASVVEASAVKASTFAAAEDTFTKEASMNAVVSDEEAAAIVDTNTMAAAERDIKTKSEKEEVSL